MRFVLSSITSSIMFGLFLNFQIKNANAFQRIIRGNFPLMQSTVARYMVSSSLSSTSLWKNVPQAPPDKILGLTEAFKSDSFGKKINLGVGAYRDDSGKPWVLPSVRSAEERIVSKKFDKEYAPIDGFKPFIDKSLEFAYGNDAEVLKSGRIAAVQSISGTGGVRLAAEFIRKTFVTADASAGSKQR
jgi:aspartate aminotransferase